MSLLIKALARAEQGKSTEAKKSLNPVDELNLDTMRLFTGPISTESASFDRGRDALGNGEATPHAADQLKQATATRHAQRNLAVPKGTWLVAGAGAVVAILLGLGLYLYLQSLGEPELIVAQNEISPQPNIETPVTPAIIGTPDVLGMTAAPEHGKESPDPQEQRPQQESDGTRAGPAASLFTSRQGDNSAPPALQGRPVLEKVRRFGDPVETSPDTTVKITRNKTVSGVSPSLASAYQALVAGNDILAERGYREVLQDDARNVDALLGMATLAARQGKTQEAQRWYGQVLEIEPRNSTAQAALIELGSQADPLGSETKLKNLLAQHPDAAYLHAALGDLYAGQSMWPAAQQAYFQAHHYQPNEPHYTFNLAISLDQMAKPELAVQYYQRTLRLIERVPLPDIDRAQIEARIGQLQP